MRPQGVVERVALWLNLGPVPLVQAFFGMMGARAAMAGGRLGVYRALARSARPLPELASELRASEEGLSHLLSALEALRLVRRRGEKWELSPRSRRWLDPSSPKYVGDFLELNYAQWEWWSELEEAVRRGEGRDVHSLSPGDPLWGTYMRGMFQLARLAAPEVARHIRLPPHPTRLLDLGGGHGWFSAELCRRNPALRATVIDLPGSAQVGREILAAEGMADRVQHAEGDVLQVDLGAEADGILCFQLLHHLDEAQAHQLVARMARALRPGGTAAILELVSAERPRPDAQAMLALHYFLMSTSRTYSRAQIEGWLREAGLEVERAVRIRRIPLMTLITARKP